MLRVAAASVGLDVFQSTNVRADVSAELSFDDEFLNGLAECCLFFCGNIFRLFTCVNLECRERGKCARAADAINGGESYLKALFFGYGDASNTHKIRQQASGIGHP